MRKIWLFIPLSLAALVTCRADSVTLVTGEKITGTIKEQTDAEVTIEVPISASITDERTIRKEDIAKIEKEQADELEYKTLRELQPNPQASYAPQTYEQILTSLRAFESKYPNSPYLDDIKKQAAAFEEEKQKVEGGQVKYLGQWISKDEAARRRIQIEAQEILATMQQQAASGDFMGAMQTFDGLEKNYGTTRSYPRAVTLALQVLTRLQQDLASRAQQIVASDAQMRQTILATPPGPERTNLIANNKLALDHDAAVIAAAKAKGAKWVPLIPRSSVSISTLQQTVTSESARLQGIPVATMTQSIAQVDAARAAMAAGDFKTADADLKQATQLWNQDEAAHYWTERLAEKMATPTPTPKPTARPSPSAAPRPSAAALAPSVQTAAQSGPDKPFLATPLGMTSVGLVVLAVVAAAAYTMQKKKGVQVE